MTKFQAQNKLKIKNSKQKFFNLLFVLWIYFGFCALVFVICPKVYALDLTLAKQYFLEGEYKAAIKEGENILSRASYSPELDELYYLLGLSYLEDGFALRASDIFEIILTEFPGSRLKEEAALGRADAYLALGDNQKADKIYQELLSASQDDKIKEQASLRLNQIYYTVDLGIFSRKIKAENLARALSAKAYPVFITEEKSGIQVNYKVKVGKNLPRQEALDLQKKLSDEGYPAKISLDAKAKN